jgi:glycosyltransferase involved in cell wall biosynthesis
MGNIELSIVMPCLNEAATIETCIGKAFAYLRAANVTGEIVVADNGSSDGSQARALAAGARVISVAQRGYGAAISSGIAQSRGIYVIMGDADDSYNFRDLDLFLAKLREGHDFVMGNRFQGGIAKGAMPALHRYLGNPVLSFIGRLFFKTPIGDFHCGLRAFRRDSILGLKLSATGMEFASEMVVKATLANLRVAEVPTTLSRDGRGRAPHLRTWRDGWRHLRFLLMFSPRWLFLYPGVALLILGTALQTLLYHGGLRLGNVGLDVHTMLYAAATAVIGVQMIWFGIFTKVYGIASGFLPQDSRIDRVLTVLTLERGLIVGLTLLVAGFVLSGRAIFGWASVGYGALDPREVMRTAIPAVAMMIGGMEFVLASFFLGILRIPHETPHR